MMHASAGLALSTTCGSAPRAPAPGPAAPSGQPRAQSLAPPLPEGRKLYRSARKGSRGFVAPARPFQKPGRVRADAPSPARAEAQTLRQETPIDNERPRRGGAEAPPRALIHLAGNEIALDGLFVEPQRTAAEASACCSSPTSPPMRASPAPAWFQIAQPRTGRAARLMGTICSGHENLSTTRAQVLVNGWDITSRLSWLCSPSTRLNVFREPVVVVRQNRPRPIRGARRAYQFARADARAPQLHPVANGQVSLSLSQRAGLAPAAAWSGAGIGCDLALIEHAAKRSSPSGSPLRAGVPGGGRRR